VNELFGNGGKHRGNIKELLLPANPGVKNNMQHQVAQFLFQSRVILLQNSIGELVHFFQGKIAQRLKGLFLIPGALGAQLIHNGKQAVKSCQFLTSFRVFRGG